MTTASREILHRLADLGAQVDRQGDKLILRAGNATVPKAILAQIRAHKAEVLRALSADAEQDDFEPCADLREVRAGVSVAWTEGVARLDLDQNTATIETQTGARQTYRRKADQPGHVLAWELV